MKYWYEKPLGAALLKDLQTPVAKAQPAARHSKINTRMYAAARADRLTQGWAVSNGSADSELVQSITMLRARSRALCRDASYAKRARMTVISNVIGSGINMQPMIRTSRDELNDRVNDDIKEVFKEWCAADSFHTGGRLSLPLFERACMSQVFTAGEVFIRIHYRRFGGSTIPLALELIEAERIADELTSPFLSATSGNEVRMGIEVDEWYRPVSYFIRRKHPSEFRFSNGSPDLVEQVPARDIIHLSLIDRWPQTRGEPWLHTAARRLNDMDGYSEAEITRARSQACTVGAIETPESVEEIGEAQEDGDVEMELEPGIIQRLKPGEKLSANAPSAPNPALDPFMRYMLREVAAGANVSYESISRDYSQSNYSSSRLALLEDRDLWRFFQSWFVCEFRQPLHRIWLQQAVLSRAITTIPVEQYALSPQKFNAVLFKPRGWTWIDPTKEVEAYKEAIKAGFTTRTDTIAATGGGQDVEEIDETRERELKHSKAKGLRYDTDPEAYMAEVDKTKADAKSAAGGKPPAAKEEKEDDSDETDQNDSESRRRVIPLKRT